jgi:hypothetical protein
MIESVILFVLGSFIGYISPKLPVLIITRAKGFNYHFPRHPEPISLSPHLTQRLLHMRTFYWLGLGISSKVMLQDEQRTAVNCHSGSGKSQHGFCFDLFITTCNLIAIS